MTFPDHELDRIKAIPISEIIGRDVTWDRAKTNAHAGDFWACCPFHAEKTPSFHCDDRRGTYKCFGCGAAGDGIGYLMERHGLTFVEAVESLGGKRDAPELSPEQKAALEAERAAKAAADARDDNIYRARELRRAREIWTAGRTFAGSPGETIYWRGRGLWAPGRPGERSAVYPSLRFAEDLPYYAPALGKGQKPRLIYSGPAVLAAIVGPADGDDLRFQGVHITWFDPDHAGEKVRLIDPATGEGLPAKKIRGSKARGWILLRDPRRVGIGIGRLRIGEGVETVRSYWQAEEAVRGADGIAATAYATSIDLQSMGGPAMATVAHPSATHTTKTGKVVPDRVPGPVPDTETPRALRALMLPDSVREVLMLGDSDSDAFTARQVHARAAARWARPGRRIGSVWAPEGEDFNDRLKERAQAALGQETGTAPARGNA
ncbi:CHC2-type zinc finger protein [Breoghania corrubedonensis]|uniref:CHC2-type zinc finger protein n=1 Tax=Breoghania corrubedonensis TaxID=665038 RepID=A0A2T5UQX2_9HYPH|nr:CHC2 zinc finger domain-containing protein [Breoghania corrubedonensis]PTW53904.1 CHC2-type zinc finger protein [Breoghania corrubedonensis]